MDRVQPLKTHKQAEAFMPEIHPGKLKAEPNNELVLKLQDLEDYNEEDSPIVIITRRDENEQQQEKLKSPQKVKEVPKILISNELNQFRTVSDFENINDINKFAMAYSGRTSCKIMTHTGLTLFKGKYPKSKLFEGCHSERLEKFVDIIDEFQNSELVLRLKYIVPSCQACFEEESTTIYVLDGADEILATINQKKIWMNSNIARDVLIQPGPHGISDTYKAEFSWNDLTVNLKAKKTGVIVANMQKEPAKDEFDFTLEILREIKPCDKAILVAFMLARDLLMIDEKQTRTAVKRFTSLIVLSFVVVIVMYFFIYP